MNRLDRHFAFLQVSAAAHAIHPQVVGYGVEASWPDGLGTKINALRRFVRQIVADDDILVFADAFDVMVFAQEEDVIARFEELERMSNRSLVFNAEQVCFPNREGVCDNYPEAPHRWRYLNSGLIAGRGHALKNMLQDEVPNVIVGSDQFWYQQYFRRHTEDIWLDTGCVLFCAVWGLDAARDGAGLKDGIVFVPETGSTPSLVHFVSVGHWTNWQDGRSTSMVHETFRQLYPEAAAAFLDPWWVGFQMGTDDATLYAGPGLWPVMRGVLCVLCNILGSRERECEFFRGLFCWYCWPTTVLLVVVAVVGLLVMLRLCRPGRPLCPLLQRPWAVVCIQCQHKRRATVQWLRLQLGPVKKQPELLA